MMAGKNPLGASVIAELLSEYPELPTHQISRMAYSKNPELWKNLEATRCQVRYMRGALGESSRKHGPNYEPSKHDPRTNGKAAPVVQARQPQSRETFPGGWSIYSIRGAQRVLILSDIHVPFHDMDAMEAAVSFGKKEGATVVLLNGDAADFHAISRWETDPRERRFAEEIETMQKMLHWIRAEFPTQRIIWKKGNHEERWESYMIQKAPELLSLPHFQFAEVFEADEHQIEIVGDMRPIEVGKLLVIHGHEYKFAISNPVNPARGLYLRAKTSALCGHHHLRSEHQEKDLREKQHTTYSTGCLCQTLYKHSPINNHSQGFAFVTTEDDGAWHVQNLKVIKGKVW